MNILLNTESLHPPLTGIGNYTLNLIEQLNRLEAIDHLECFSGTQFFTAQEAIVHCRTAQPQTQHTQPSQTSRLRALARRIPFAYQARAWLRNWQLRRHAAQCQRFLYHEPNFILKNHEGPCVATIHDLSFIHYPQYHPAERVAWIGGQLPKTLRRADFLITPSELIRQELIQHHNVPEHRVRSIYLGAAECFQPRTAAQTHDVLKKYALTHGNYLLFVASLEPRKGIDVLLDAWCRLPKALQQQWPLVLAGAPGWQNAGLQNRIASLQKSHGLRHLHFVPADDLPALYAGAALFAYPSLYEGFGLPVLEAMRCGVPVVSTAGTSMAEFAQEGIAQVSRGDADALAHTLTNLLEQEEQRQQLAQRGWHRAQAFSWERCARETLSVYREVLESSR